MPRNTSFYLIVAPMRAEIDITIDPIAPFHNWLISLVKNVGADVAVGVQRPKITTPTIGSEMRQTHHPAVSLAQDSRACVSPERTLATCDNGRTFAILSALVAGWAQAPAPFQRVDALPAPPSQACSQEKVTRIHIINNSMSIRLQTDMTKLILCLFSSTIMK